MFLSNRPISSPRPRYGDNLLDGRRVEFTVGYYAILIAGWIRSIQYYYL